MTHQSHSAKPCPTATLVQRLSLPTIYKVLQPLGKVCDPTSEGKVVWWPSQWRQGRVVTQPVKARSCG